MNIDVMGPGLKENMKYTLFHLSNSIKWLTQRAAHRLVLGLILLLGIFPGNTYGQDNTQSTDSLKEVITAIHLIEIPQEVVAITRKINTEIAPELKRQVAYETHMMIDSVQSQVKQLGQLSDQLLEEQLPYNFYQSLLLRWSRIDRRIETPENVLKEYSSDLSEIRNILKHNKNIWIKTGIETLDKDSPVELIKRVDEVIDQIDSVSLLLKDSLNLSLNLLNGIAEIKLTVGNYKRRIDATQNIQYHELLKVRTNPIWSADFSQDSTVVFGINKDLIAFVWRIHKDTWLPIKRYFQS